MKRDAAAGRSTERRAADAAAAERVASRLPTIAVAIGIVAATLIAYIPAMLGGYIWDDDSYVHQNLLVQGGLRELGHIWIPGNTPQYYPLVFTMFWIEDKLWGIGRPAGFHVVNILLHAANALLVWRVARRIGVPGAAFVGALFALHPVHVESVAWITERKNVLSGLFYLLAFAAYLRFDATGRWRWYATCAGLFIAALLSKSVTASLPAALMLLFFHSRKLTRRHVAALTVLLALGAAFGVNTARLERSHVGADGPEWSYSSTARATIIAPRAFLFYAEKIAWPAPLIFIYPRWEPHATNVTHYGPLAAVVLIFGAAFMLVRRIGWGPLLLLCFSAGTLFPALGFLNVYPHRYSFVADHFNYLGSLGFIILYVAAGAWVVERLAGGRAAFPTLSAIAFVLLAACGVLTSRQCREYKDVTTLWESTLAKNPEAWIALVNLGELHRLRWEDALARGQTSANDANEAYARGDSGAGNLAVAAAERAAADARTYEQRAEELFQRALKYSPARGAALGNLGLMALRRGETETAIDYLRRSAELVPEDHAERWFVLSRYGEVLRQSGKLAEALPVLRRAAELAPERVDPHFYLAQLLMQLERYAEARRSYEHVLRLDATNLIAYRGAAEAANQTGECDAALRMIEQGRRLAADDAVLRFQLIWLRSGCPDERYRNGAEALDLARQLADEFGRNADTHDALAAACAETGDFANAIWNAKEALAAAKQSGDVRLIAEIEARLALYESGKPYRAGSQ